MHTMHKDSLKIGTSVSFTRRGLPVAGRVAGNDVRVNGLFISVNTAPKGANARLVSKRRSQLIVV